MEEENKQFFIELRELLEKHNASIEINKDDKQLMFKLSDHSTYKVALGFTQYTDRVNKVCFFIKG